MLRPDRPPTARQIYALAAAFCVKGGYEWPASRAEASELLAEIRREIGHPRAELADNLLRRGRPKWARDEEWELHHEVADAFLRRPS